MLVRHSKKKVTRGVQRRLYEARGLEVRGVSRDNAPRQPLPDESRVADALCKFIVEFRHDSCARRKVINEREY